MCIVPGWARSAALMGSDPCRTVGSFVTLSQESWVVSWSPQCGWPPADAGCSWPCIQPLPALMSQSPKRRPVSSLLDPGKGHSILFLEGSPETPEHIVAQVVGGCIFPAWAGDFPLPPQKTRPGQVSGTLESSLERPRGDLRVRGGLPEERQEVVGQGGVAQMRRTQLLIQVGESLVWGAEGVGTGRVLS